MTFQEFEALVNGHDLTFAYSNDHSVWQNGQTQYDRIMKASKEFPAEDVKRVWNAMVDKRLLPHAREQFYWV